MPILAKKLAVATLRHRIVEEVRQAILNGSLCPGERLVERDLAARLGTSLTVAREAIIQLETEGLIIKRPNSSTHVNELSPREVNDLFSVRCVLEEYAVFEAARHGTTLEIGQLNRLHEERLRLANAGTTRRYIQQDMAWHEAVWQMSRNEFLTDSLRRVLLPLAGFSLIACALHEGFDLSEDAHSHDQLHTAIVRHDAPASRKAYRTAAEIWKAKLLNIERQEDSPKLSARAPSRSQARLTGR
jgi:DNA-binding GntR family transcriptional regulator